jgi:hypothetical protein
MFVPILLFAVVAAIRLVWLGRAQAEAIRPACR